MGRGPVCGIITRRTGGLGGGAGVETASSEADAAASPEGVLWAETGEATSAEEVTVPGVDAPATGTGGVGAA